MMKKLFLRILASTTISLVAGLCPQVLAQAPEHLNNSIVILHGGQPSRSLVLDESCEQSVIREEKSQHSSVGTTFVFETQELKLQEYQKENFGFAKIVYERLDERNALLLYQDAELSDMWTPQTLLVFESPTSGHYYEIEYLVGTKGRITTIHCMGSFCIRQRDGEPEGVYIGESDFNCN